jgi:hypothetical protein
MKMVEQMVARKADLSAVWTVEHLARQTVGTKVE